ncbi:MAG: hypothetical protein JNK82_13695 [Myxococcaceae bacterium]|nr:hypothetical protein [Myxococcaceae bacterium]
MTSLLPALLGLTFGLRHAFEPDHLAAVSALSADQRSWRAAGGIGLSWGLGHALTLLVFGGALSLFEVSLPERAESLLELLVAAVIIGLGVRAVLRALAEGRAGPVALHAHGEEAHAHAAGGDHLHFFGLTLATRPLLVGALHGLAGSGALVTLVLLELPGFGQRLLYITLFGLGAAAAMAGLTALAGLPLSRVVKARRALLGVSGSVSIAVGLFWAAAALSPN